MNNVTLIASLSVRNSPATIWKETNTLVRISQSIQWLIKSVQCLATVLQNVYYLQWKNTFCTFHFFQIRPKLISNLFLNMNSYCLRKIISRVSNSWSFRFNNIEIKEPANVKRFSISEKYIIQVQLPIPKNSKLI